MAFQRGIDGPEAARPETIEQQPARHEKRRASSSSLLALGTLACPGCDAPVAPPDSPKSPADPLGCGFCGHSATVRHFLSFAVPTRPTRVEVRVVEHGELWRRSP